MTCCWIKSKNEQYYYNMNTIKNTFLSCILVCFISVTTFAQVPGSALDHLLQKPRVTKYYKDKKVFNHVFVDLGAGVNALGPNHITTDPFSEFNFGNWFTPEHGLRFHMNLGRFKTGYNRSKYFSLGFDYLLNITALSKYGSHYTPRRFELYGLAGADHNFFHYGNGTHGNGIDVHIGLRGQVALSPFTYFYIEPRIGVIDDDVSLLQNWHGYRPVATASAGLGYRLPAVRRHTNIESSGPGNWKNGLFIGLMAGPTMQIDHNPTNWTHNKGMRITGSIGKLFGKTRTNGLRLSVNGTLFQPQYKDNVNAAGAQMDYILNLHNVFDGYNPDRWFWVNAIAGVSYNYSHVSPDISNNTFGGGAGLQTNFHLSRNFDFIIEPRVDMYGQRYSPQRMSFSRHDVMASVLAGIQMNLEFLSRPANYNKDEHERKNSSIMFAGGMSYQNIRRTKTYSPLVRVGYTHWYSDIAAWRINAQGFVRKAVKIRRLGQISLGIDWMNDITALTYGYDPSRLLSVKAFAGANAGIDYGNNRTTFAPDIHAGAQLALRVNDAIHLNVEPQLTYQLSSRWNSMKERVMPQVLVGIDYSMQRNHHKSDAADTPDHANVIMAGAGIGMYTRTYRELSTNSERMNFNVDLGYGRWLGPASGVYARLSNQTAQRRDKHNQNLTSLQAGYMMNVKSAITGESTDTDIFQLTALMGASMNMSSRKGLSNNYALGMQAAIQAGAMVTPKLEVYVEPSANIMSKTIEKRHNTHNLEATAKFSIGTKIHF